MWRLLRSLVCPLAALLALLDPVRIALVPSVALGQSNLERPFTGTLSDRSRLEPNQADVVERATQQALMDLQVLGGSASARAKLWADLSPSALIERLAIEPPVGPSTIAAPKAGTSIPSPSVNWVGEGGGATVGHPGVVLLLAKLGGEDRFLPHCTGTMVRQDTVLTAAHCVCHSIVTYPTATKCLGGDRMTVPSELLEPSRWRVFNQYTGIRRIKKVSISSDYKFGKSGVRHDIAVLALTHPELEILPASFPPASDDASAWTTGGVVGFGYSANPNAAAAGVLQDLLLPGLKAQGDVSSAPCDSESYLERGAGLCSIYRSVVGSQATICGGDSGGPMWQSMESPLQIGVASGRNNENCAALGTVGFEMAVAYRPHWK